MLLETTHLRMSDMEKPSTLNVRLTVVGPKDSLMDLLTELLNSKIAGSEDVQITFISMDLNNPKDTK